MKIQTKIPIALSECDAAEVVGIDVSCSIFGDQQIRDQIFQVRLAWLVKSDECTGVGIGAFSCTCHYNPCMHLQHPWNINRTTYTGVSGCLAGRSMY